MKKNLSVTIITLNEESNIERAIRSASFADEIIVVDSGSVDHTVLIATNLGAKVIPQKFLGFGQQKNYAATFCRNEWILNIDADEEISEELKNSILEHTTTSSSSSSPLLYKVNRLNFFCGKAITHGGWYPDMQVRLYHKNYCEWTTPHVHEELTTKKECSEQSLRTVGTLQGHLHHYTFKTLMQQVQTNIRYASLGAAELLKRQNGRKLRFYSLLFRPFFKFIECYFIKLGFLDGRFGFIIAINAAYSMFLKYAFSYVDTEVSGIEIVTSRKLYGDQVNDKVSN
ncbi:MAG: glycosyltransferase family 2 protein [Oligoflexia bacterium]|nr:glycosyltransferase family 2 protein [Oligoflexia bacterium]MBF0367306.1 glycosyltransferase family 2 protein [Oligoflexia bacterium]